MSFNKLIRRVYFIKSFALNAIAHQKLFAQIYAAKSFCETKNVPTQESHNLNEITCISIKISIDVQFKFDLSFFSLSISRLDTIFFQVKYNLESNRIELNWWNRIPFDKIYWYKYTSGCEWIENVDLVFSGCISYWMDFVSCCANTFLR